MNIPTTHTEAWNECFSQFRLMGPLTQNMLRRSASERLVACGFNEVGSSDTNNELYNMWHHAGGDWQKAILTEVDTYINNGELV